MFDPLKKKIGHLGLPFKTGHTSLMLDNQKKECL